MTATLDSHRQLCVVTQGVQGAGTIGHPTSAMAIARTSAMLCLACCLALAACLRTASAAAAMPEGAATAKVTPAMAAAAKQAATARLQAALERTAGSGTVAEQVIVHD